jgi:antitoxin component YwqK of YwqJK toxin-antitoxin module
MNIKHYFLCLIVILSTNFCKNKNNSTQTKDEKISSKQDTIAPVKDGPYTEYYKNGNLKAEGEILNGLREGTWISYSAEGVIMSKCDYTKGVKNGNIEVFHPNGNTLYKGKYENNKEIGVWEFYSIDGKKQKTKDYSPKNHL